MTHLLEQLARHAASQPGAIALRNETASMTWREFAQASVQIANRLATLNVGEGDVVALCLDRSFHQIAAAYAILRRGAAYLPLDPAWPAERLRAILADSGATALVASHQLSATLNLALPTLSPAEDTVLLAACDPHHLDPIVSPDALAYLIYTSGSTGTPKGVEITHRNLAHLIARYTEAFAVTPADRASHLAGLGFDGAVWELWPHLAAGASLTLVDDLARTSPQLLQQWLVDQRITIAFVPTALAEPMMRQPWPADTSLRFLLVAGEALHTTPRPGLPFPVYNSYGPSECTVMATFGEVAPATEGVPTLGTAMPGTRVSVLNERRQPAWIGETGEIYIGGDGVGRGYRNLPEQTAHSFIIDPITRARLYRTGDHGAQLADGEIDFRGRSDGQEKIRGQRLELGEIVAILNRHPEVAFNTVVALGEGAEKRLVAYVLPANDTAPGARALQSFLAETLPAYMVPAIFVRLEHIPVTPNGKLDRAALPHPAADNTLPEAPARGPETPTEETLLDIVRRLVKSTDIGVEDDFFLVGGHSLLGTQLVMRVRERFGVPLTLRDLFEGATVAQLAQRVEEMLIEELDAMTEEDALKQVAD